MAQALSVFEVTNTPDGCTTDLVSVLTKITQQVSRRYPQVFANDCQPMPEDQQSINKYKAIPGFDEDMKDTDRVLFTLVTTDKFTADTRNVSANPKIPHTEAMVNDVNKKLPHAHQDPHVHGIVGLYEGKDDHAKMKANFHGIAKRIKEVTESGFLMRVANPRAQGDARTEEEPYVIIHVKPTILFAADMATQWGWFGVGGQKDKEGQLCTLCTTRTADRWRVFEWVRVGDHVDVPALLEDQSVPVWYDAKLFADQFGMRPCDLYILNSQNPLAEGHLQSVTKVGEFTRVVSSKIGVDPPILLETDTSATGGQDTSGSNVTGDQVDCGKSKATKGGKKKGVPSEGDCGKSKATKGGKKKGANKTGWKNKITAAAQNMNEQVAEQSCIRSCDQKAFHQLQAYLQPEVLRPGEVGTCHGSADCEGKGCPNCSLKLDSIVRVVARDVECDRDTSKTAIYDFPKFLILFCALHCVMRVTECLFTSLAEIAQKAGKECVIKVNLILRQYGVSFQMKELKEKRQKKNDGDFDAQYNAISLPGNCAKKMADAAPSIIALLFPLGVCEDDSLPILPENVTGQEKKLSRGQLCQQRDWNKRLWYWWGKVIRMMYDTEPGPDHSKQFDLAISSLLVCLASFHSEDEARSLYLHTLACHARTMNRRWGGLAPFANQGAELKHTFGKRAFSRTGRGGCFGRKKEPKKQEETPDDATSAPPPERKPKATLYWPKTEPGTVEPKHTTEQVKSNAAKLRTILVVFQQLLLACFMALVYMCRECDAYGDCKHTAKSRHGNFTPARIRKKADLLAEQFAHIPDVFSKHDEKYGYLGNNPEDLEGEGKDDSEGEDDEEATFTGKRSRALFDDGAE
jgi:hypothetical protein